MKRLLMILTSHRLDCLRLNLDLQVAHGDLAKFDQVVFLLNKVSARHMAYVDDFIARHPEVAFDKVLGSGIRPQGIAAMQNECIRRYPGCLYFKTDEDVFTSKGWVDKLTAAYEAHKDNDDLGLIAPVSPNNGIGCYFLLTHLREVREAYDQAFDYPVVPDYEAPVWLQPELGRYMTRQFLDMNEANRDLEQRFGPGFKAEHALRFSHRFTINCICYDYRHIQQMGEIPETDEPGWTQWVADNSKFHLLVPNVLVHHYSFFVQQDWMDRSHILEDIRRINLPGTMGGPGSLSYELPRLQRVIKQAPRALVRKAKHLAKR